MSRGNQRTTAIMAPLIVTTRVQSRFVMALCAAWIALLPAVEGDLAASSEFTTRLAPHC